MKRLQKENQIKPLKIIDIQEITDEDINVPLEGKIYKIEKKYSKTKEWKIYTFYLTNYKSAIKINGFANLTSNTDRFGRAHIITDAYLSTFEKNDWVRCLCDFKFDKRSGTELAGSIKKITKIDPPKKYKRVDDAKHKRAELLCHTNMSSFDGTSKIEDIMNKVKDYEWNTIGIVDRNNVHIFPHAAIEAKKTGTKIIYGCELNVLDDSVTLSKNTYDQDLEDA